MLWRALTSSRLFPSLRCVTQNQFQPNCSHTTTSKLDEQDWVVPGGGGSEPILCWHPEPAFPYEHSKPMPRLEPEMNEEDSVLKIKHRIAFKHQYRLDWHERKACFHQETMNMLRKLTYTNKHIWYRNASAKKTLGEIPPDREHL